MLHSDSFWKLGARPPRILGTELQVDFLGRWSLSYISILDGLLLALNGHKDWSDERTGEGICFGEVLLLLSMLLWFELTPYASNAETSDSTGLFWSYLFSGVLP
jgi:hypothetical protein